MTPANYSEEFPEGTGALLRSRRRVESLDPQPMPRFARVCPVDLSGWQAQSGASTTAQSMGMLGKSSQLCGALRPRSDGHLRPRTDGDIPIDMDRGDMERSNSRHLGAELESSEEHLELLSNTDSDSDDDDVGSKKLVKSKRQTPAEYASVSFGAADLHAIEEALYSSQQSEESDRARPVARAYPMDFSGLQIRPPEAAQSEVWRPRSRGRLLSFSQQPPCPNEVARPKTDGELANGGHVAESDAAAKIR